MSKSPFDLKHQNENIDSRIIAAMERISQAFRVLLWNESKELALSPIQIQILVFLMFHSEEKRKVGYLATEFNMTKATISDSIKVLEQKKLIRKESETQDTRSYVIHLTTKGLEIAKRTAAFANHLLAPVSKLNAEDKENLLISLMGIIQHLNKTGVITIQRMCKTCAHFSAGNGKTQHFCHLLNQKLSDTDLRLDCPEHLIMNWQMDTSFTPVSYDHREMIEDEIKNCKTVKVFFFNSELRLDGVEGRIEKLVEWPGHGWFIKLTPEALIRIDRIITVNGRPGPAYDEYDSYANACLDCKGGYDLD